MESDLDILIDEYFKEKEALEDQIKDCLAHEDYLNAHYLSLASGEVNQKLRTFRNLKHQDYDEVQSLTTLIGFYEKEILQSTNDQLKQFLEANIQEAKDKLAAKGGQENKFRLDNQQIFDLLKDMCHGKLRGFKLYLIEKENLFLKVSLGNTSNLEIVFTPFDDINANYALNGTHQQKLRSIGFKEKAGSLFRNIENFGVNDINEVIETMARVIFEVFYFKELDAMAKAEIE